MHLWDTAGQEQYRSIGPVYYRSAAAAIAVFDVTVPDFQTSLSKWIKTVQQNSSDPLIYIVGNKVDLLENDGEIAAELSQFAEIYNAEHFLTSAKTGLNVESLFSSVFEGLVRSHRFIVDRSDPPLTNGDETKGRCCWSIMLDVYFIWSLGKKTMESIGFAFDPPGEELWRVFVVSAPKLRLLVDRNGVLGSCLWIEAAMRLVLMCTVIWAINVMSLSLILGESEYVSTGHFFPP